MFRSPFCPRPAPEPPRLGRRTGCNTPWTWTFFRLETQKDRNGTERKKEKERQKKVEKQG
jgi:hypothetical protein